jgi:ribosomal protein L11 methylase PrmA
MMQRRILESSFRDPCGFLFYDGERLLRQVNTCCREDYETLMASGLYEALCAKGLLIRHEEQENHPGVTDDAFKVIEPEKIGFISYPYEWCFSQLKDAALTTVAIQKTALEHGMILKDASAYNIQFHKGRPLFIDTLSFGIWRESQPWQAYRQFCQHFLAPLALMCHTDIRLSQLMKVYLDGIPLDLAARLLPFRTKLNFPLLMHLHLHARAQKKYAGRGAAARNVRISRSNLSALVQSLETTVRNLRMKPQKTEWSGYYSETNYSGRSFEHKKEIIAGFIKTIRPRIAWDLGANTGIFSQIAAQEAQCIAFDIDPASVESHYNYNRKQRIENILPLVMDLTNPSPSIGFAGRERPGLMSRPLPDTVIAVALVHHLAISNNLPLGRIAAFLSELGENLVIEFVPKTDSQVKKLLESRKDIFPDYNEETFVKEFEACFEVMAAEKVTDSERVIYLMKRKKG